MSIKFTGEGLLVDEELLPLYSGTFHYWRHEKSLWGSILDNIKAMGFNMVETYIPWSVHELRKGVYDFGEIDENKDVDGFLRLCGEKGLKVFVRPGPHINAELTLFGYPERIIYDPQVQAMSPWGTPVMYPYFTKQFPIPGYASEKLYSEAEKYFDALAPILLRHQHPLGAIVAIQIDNETNYFFRDRAYVMDYSQDSIKLYRRMLKEKYVTINSLNASYGTSHEDFDSINAPTGFAGEDKSHLPYYFDWIIYKEYQINYALRRISKIWRDRGISLPAYHNASCQYYTPVDSVLIEGQEVEVIGIDMYLCPKEYEDIRKKVKYMAGTSRLPFIPEYGSGVWFDHPKTPEMAHEEFTTVYCFMNGLKAINYYMLVERERWQGCPITRDNRVRQNYFDFYKSFNAFLEKEKFHLFRRAPKILVMKNYDLGRFRALYSIMDLNALCSNTFVRGFEIPAALFRPNVNLGFRYCNGDYIHWAEEEWIDGISARLVKENLDFNISDSHLDIEKMREYPVIFASTYDFMRREEQEKLIKYAEQGGRLILGPGIPYLDMDMRELHLLSQYGLRGNADRSVEIGKGSMTLCTRAESFEPSTLDLKPEYRCSDDRVELCVHYSGNRQLLFAANVSNEALSGEITFSGRKSFFAKWNAADMADCESIKVQMEPYTVSIWEVE